LRFDSTGIVVHYSINIDISDLWNIIANEKSVLYQFILFQEYQISKLGESILYKYLLPVLLRFALNEYMILLTLVCIAVIERIFFCYFMIDKCI